MIERDLTIDTADAPMDAFLALPEGNGPARPAARTLNAPHGSGAGGSRPEP